jgi:AcrR family transcriptional regulator
MTAGAESSDFPSPSRRGRTPTRDVHEIAGAAVALADREGLAAVTMRSVARAIGTGAASLYRYVTTRDELVEIMVELVNGEFELDGPSDRPWVDQMLDLATQAREIYRRHPWMLEALDVAPALGPHGLAYLDYALAILRPTGADGRSKLEAVGVFSGLVRLLCRQERDQALASRSPSRQQERLAHQLGPAAATGRYPDLAAALAGAGGTEQQFERILRRVVAGLLASDD